MGLRASENNQHARRLGIDAPRLMLDLKKRVHAIVKFLYFEAPNATSYHTPCWIVVDPSDAGFPRTCTSICSYKPRIVVTATAFDSSTMFPITRRSSSDRGAPFYSISEMRLPSVRWDGVLCHLWSGAPMKRVVLTVFNRLRNEYAQHANRSKHT